MARRSTLILLTVLAYAAFVAIKLAGAGGDASIFVVAGDRFVDRGRLDVPLAVQPHSNGLDGQFAYRLALDPFTTRRTAHGITLDTPGLRAQRVGYPLLAYFVSLGSPARTAASLIAVNLAGLALLAWAATGVALFYRRPAWHGMIVTLYPGLLLTLSHDTGEIVATALSVCAVLFGLRGRPWTAGLVACAAVLTRETSLPYLFGFGAVTAWRAIAARRPDRRIVAFLLPVLTLLLWQAVLVAVWGNASFTEVGGNDLALPPLRHFVTRLASDIASLLAPGFEFRRLYPLLMKPFLIAQVAIAAACLRRTHPVDWRLTLGWASYLLLASLFTDDIWREPFGYLRVGIDLYVTGCLVILASPGDRHLMVLLKLAVPLWLVEWAYA